MAKRSDTLGGAGSSKTRDRCAGAAAGACRWRFAPAGLIVVLSLSAPGTLAQKPSVEPQLGFMHRSSIGRHSDYYDDRVENQIAFNSFELGVSLIWSRGSGVRGMFGVSLEPEVQQSTLGFGYIHSFKLGDHARLALYSGVGIAFTSRLVNESGDAEGNGYFVRSGITLSYKLGEWWSLIGGLGHEFSNTSARYTYTRNGRITETYGYSRQFLMPSLGIGFSF